MTTKYTQGTYKALILEHLMTGEQLEPMKALKLWHCFSLAQRISEMKQDGIPIHSKIVTAPSGKRHAVYWLDQDHITWAKHGL